MSEETVMDWPSTLPPCPILRGVIDLVAAAGADHVERMWSEMEPNTMDCDTPTALRFLASSAKQAEAEWMRKAADEIERLVGLAAFASPDMVKWLTDQVMRRDNVIEAMKSAGMEQITKAFTENRWIPVSERLPEEGVEVLAWLPSDEQACAGCVRDGYWCSPDIRLSDYPDRGDPEGPTHWMPLPEPPAP